MLRPIINRSVLGASMVLLAVLATACSASGSGGQSKTVNVGCTAPITGANSAGMPLFDAVDAFFKNANATGGINGYQVKFTMLDDQNSAALGINDARQLVTQNKVVALACTSGTAATLSMTSYLNSQKIPTLAESGSDQAATPYTFLMLPDSANQGLYELQYAIKQAAGAKVALVYQNDSLGQPFQLAADSLVKQGNAIAEVPFQATTSDWTPVVARLQQAGAEYVVAAGSTLVFPQLIKAAVTLNYTPTWLAQNYHENANVLESLPAAQTSKLYFLDPYALATAPESADMRTALAKYYPEVKPQGLAVQGWATATVFAHALELATANGKQPTSASITDALNSLNGYSNNYIHNLSFDPSSGVKAPHLPRLNSAITKWDPASKTFTTATDYVPMPKLEGRPGQ